MMRSRMYINAEFDTSDTAICFEYHEGLATKIPGRLVARYLSSLRVVKALRAGVVWVNHMQPTFIEAPWGGYKQSGFGRESGPCGIGEYLEMKQVHINLNEQPIGRY